MSMEGSKNSFETCKVTECPSTKLFTIGLPKLRRQRLLLHPLDVPLASLSAVIESFLEELREL